ncbi:MAG: stage II sporulation protein P [Firmicutes bacterium]|nr:stage II sporulation protein P [Bacillota bacterium]
MRRQPVIIWLRRARRRSTRRRAEPQRLGRPWPWTSAFLYAATLGLAALVLWKVPAQRAAVPVSAPLARPSPMDRWLHRLRVSSHTLTGWLIDAIPLLGLIDRPHRSEMRWGAMMETGIQEVTGVRLTNVANLLEVEIPLLSRIPPPRKQAPSKPPLVRAPQSVLDAVEPGLPGDGGRVWAVLGTDPVVGLYQTHSRESFWAYVNPASPTAYSTHWSHTIVAVGWWLAEDLAREKIGVVQSRVDNMSQGLLASYDESYVTAEHLISWFPTVRLLIDVHRQGNPVNPAVVGGQKVAKILWIVGTDQLLPNPYWRENLNIVHQLVAALREKAPGILYGSGIDIVPYRYNQQLRPGSLMVEIGGTNSTLAEEKRACEFLAAAIEEVLTRIKAKAP